MSAPAFQVALLHPRHWATWTAVGLAWLLSWLPVVVQMPLGAALGRAVGRLLRSRRAVVRANLRVAFPELGDAAREVVGLEHLRAAQADGSGVLLLTGHFTTLELGARFLCLGGVRFHAMYRPYNNAVMDYLMHHWREGRSGLPALARDDLRPLVRALRGGAPIWYAPDQALDRRLAVYAPFFGVPVGTITATSRLAKMGRARVVPYFPQRIGGRYRIVVLPALEHFPSGDEAADAARINAVIEQGIALAPAQYFWVHKRFKHLPPGTPSIYRG
jgi:Kdo2-lipid IVA lauroyltransferase/acyltransferase